MVENGGKSREEGEEEVVARCRGVEKATETK